MCLQVSKTYQWLILCQAIYHVGCTAKNMILQKVKEYESQFSRYNT